MRNTLFAVLLLTLASTGHSHAQDGFFYNGVDLMEVCAERTNVGHEIACQSYILGAYDGLIHGFGVAALTISRANPLKSFDEAMLDVLGFCGPAPFESTQLVALVVDFLEENPQEWHHEMPWLVRSALVEAFPCES